MTIKQKILIGRNASKQSFSIVFFVALFLAVQLLEQLHFHEEFASSETRPECELCHYSGMHLVPGGAAEILLPVTQLETVQLFSTKSNPSPTNFSAVLVRAPPIPSNFLNN